MIILDIMHIWLKKIYIYCKMVKIEVKIELEIGGDLNDSQNNN